jgi:hypothetical protein
MGMYTELVMNFELKNSTSKEVVDILSFLFNDSERPDILPDHEFFKCDTWDFIGNGCSHYFTPFSLSRFKGGHISTRSDLKNYDREIEKFIDWVMPYIKACEGDFLGYSRYEEDREPTLIFFKSKDAKEPRER